MTWISCQLYTALASPDKDRLVIISCHKVSCDKDSIDTLTGVSLL